MKSIIYHKIFFLIILLPLSCPLFGQQEQIRIMAYNILEYTNTNTGGSSATRDPYFKEIITGVNPDIIAASEISSETDANHFLTDVLNSIIPSNQYAMGKFVLNTNKNSDNNAIYYKSSKFTFISSKLITNYSYGNHPSYEYQLYNNLTGNKIVIYGVHFTSNSFGASASTQRNIEAGAINTLASSLPLDSYFIAAGDFNLYSGGNESAYATLLNTFIEPLGLPQNNLWSSSTYRKYYTLGTRKNGSLYGDKNGLLYKIDFIFNSQSVVDAGGIKYIGPFVTYGNDDLHYSDYNINDVGSTGLPNQAVSQTIADALYYASDHLPVYTDYSFSIPSDANPPYPGSIVFTQVGVDDGGGHNYIEFMTLYRMNLTTLKITNNVVQADSTLDTGGGTINLGSTGWINIPAGTFVRLGPNLTTSVDTTNRLIQLNTNGLGLTLSSGSNQLIAYTGSSPAPTYYIAGIHWGDTQGWTTSSNAPGTPSDIQLIVSAAANWYYNSSVNDNLYVTRNSLTTSSNWGSTSSGFQDLSSNINNSALPVELSSFTGNIKNNEVELQWRTETEVNNYGFEIQLSTDKIFWSNIGFVPGQGNSNSPKDYSFKDKFIPGGTIYYRLKQVDNDGKFQYSAIIELNYDVPSEANLSQNYPNPFNPVSIIEYTIPTSGFVSLKVYDVLGREVTTLVNETRNAGRYSVKFDGTKIASGVYFYVLTTGKFVVSKKMNLVK